MNYNLTEKQKEGLDICLKRYKNGEAYTIIAGYARNRQVLFSKRYC